MNPNPKPRLPEIGEYVRGQGTLVAVQEIVPQLLPVDKYYIFEEISARVELRLGAEVIKHVVTLWDFYGKGKSIEGAIEKAQEYVSKKGIGPQSELEVVVIKIVEQIRKLPNQYGENLRDPTFVSFESSGTGSKANLPDPVEAVVWSSKKEEP
jgi:hypothetical protein